LSVNGGKVVCLSIATSTHAAVALDNKASGAAARNTVSQKYPELVDFVPRQNKSGYHSDIVIITHTAVALDRKLLAQLHAMSYLKKNLEIVELVPDEYRWFFGLECQPLFFGMVRFQGGASTRPSESPT
jgi:hypothetical protein